MIYIKIKMEWSGLLMLIKDLIEEEKTDMEFAEIYDREGRKLKSCIKETTNLVCKIDMHVDQALTQYDSAFKELADC